jgi:hypothetical protein
MIDIAFLVSAAALLGLIGVPAALRAILRVPSQFSKDAFFRCPSRPAAPAPASSHWHHHISRPLVGEREVCYHCWIDVSVEGLESTRSDHSMPWPADPPHAPIAPRSLPAHSSNGDRVTPLLTDLILGPNL